MSSNGHNLSVHGPSLIRANQLLDYLAILEMSAAEDPKATALLGQIHAYIVAMRDNPDYQRDIRRADQYPPFQWADGRVQ